MAPEAAGFCCRGGTTLLPAAVVDPEPGLGEVGGLLAVLLASLKETERVNEQRRKRRPRRPRRSLTGPRTLLLSLPACLFLSAPSSCPSSCLCSRSAPSWEATSRGQGSLWGRSFWAVFLKQIGRNLTGSASVQSQRCCVGSPLPFFFFLFFLISPWLEREAAVSTTMLKLKFFNCLSGGVTPVLWEDSLLWPWQPSS